MSENTIIVLVVVIFILVMTVVIVWALRDRITFLKVIFGKKGIEAQYEAESMNPTRISGTTIKGNKNKLTAQNGAQLDKVKIEGDENQLKSENR